ncbi:MAG: hypothetical protein NUV69_00475 [Candidatus Curtissbacteria bacterium]|nr:hypothetical protein [Candidatus Curtissbacteria bacterium]
MTNKIIVAKSGFNALTETDPNNLIFSSDYNTFKYAISDSYTYNFTNPTPWLVITDPLQSPIIDEVTIYTHNLGYYPFFVAVIGGILSAGQYINLPYFTGSGNAPHESINLYTTTTALIFRIDSTLASKTLVIYFKIFKNNLNL